MSAPTPPELPSTNKDTFFALAQGLFVWLTTTFMTWVDSVSTAMNLNATNDTSTSSVVIGTGSKSLTVSLGKSYLPGMWVVIAATATPTVNSMVGQIASYNTGTGALVVEVALIKGSGTIAAWTLMQCAAPDMGVRSRALGGTGSAYGAQQLQPITASVAASAMTITLNSTNIDFRSTTLGSGAVTNLDVPAAISCVIPSGATMGAVNAVANRLAVLAINNAGTVELAVVNVAGGVALDESALVTTVALSAAADNNNVAYSTTARTGVAFRIVGYIESTQATAGTWAAAPSLVAGAGSANQSVNATLGYGQTWQILTGSRALATSYTNTSGKPIFVYLTCVSAGVASQFAVTVGGLEIGRSSSAEAAARVIAANFIVPPGATYSVANVTGANTVFAWSELR